ncbi:hypothetical protein BRC93_01555 [Halobacteriales archaeon QS_5_70_15]|nr:MAG: hypothetical protein BRC93_01555 [Halobacteriales archaeon QS_5_70_15]
MSGRVSRRAVLASAGGLSPSGCLGPGIPSGSTASPDGGPAVSFAAEVGRSITDDHPAALRLALANGGEGPLVVCWNVSDGQGGPFNAVRGVQRDGDAEVGLFRRGGSAALCVPGDGGPIPDTPVEGCWSPPCEGTDLPSLHGRFELPPEDPERDEYVVLDGLDGPCLRPGTYAFDEGRAGVGASVARGMVEDASVETESGWYPLERHLTLSIAEDGGVTASAEAVVRPPGTTGDGDSTPRPTPKPVGGTNPGRHG